MIIPTSVKVYSLSISRRAVLIGKGYTDFSCSICREKFKENEQIASKRSGCKNAKRHFYHINCGKNVGLLV